MNAINVPAAVDYVVACQNFDGGFGCTPGALLPLGLPQAAASLAHDGVRCCRHCLREDQSPAEAVYARLYSLGLHVITREPWPSV
jgi:hypothetical protein